MTNRNLQKRATPCECAFTLVELLVVFGVVIVLASVAVPALAKSKTRTPAAGCLSNLRQMQVGWAMYADDNKGKLMLNAPAGGTTSCWVPTGSEDWNSSFFNTNTGPLLAAPMSRYVGSNVTVFRCPGDVVPSRNGFRLRSYSMNGQVGNPFANYAPPLRLYQKESDIVCPTPANLFVLCDEHPGSLNDGFLQVSSSPRFPDVPASYLDNGCGFSFADGHAEIHKWQGKSLLIPVVRSVSFTSIPVSSTDPDWLWFSARTGCP